MTVIIIVKFHSDYNYLHIIKNTNATIVIIGIIRTTLINVSYLYYV